MALSEHGLEVGDVDVEVELGGEQGGVAEEFLDGADGSAVAEEMGGETVADAVRGGPNAGTFSGIGDELGQARSRERCSVFR